MNPTAAASCPMAMNSVVRRRRRVASSARNAARSCSRSSSTSRIPSRITSRVNPAAVRRRASDNVCITRVKPTANRITTGRKASSADIRCASARTVYHEISATKKTIRDIVPTSCVKVRTGSGISGPASCELSTASTSASAVADRSPRSLATHRSIAAESRSGSPGRIVSTEGTA